ncbi:hypothetical protein [Kordia jejudonensis]|uniref:hypothetical protein n=1 Tax=Kordia jejudonensis TaxID=1348245 RepID=UPI0012E0B661|nr:hypothetical protein [Kordia jejudonensis]
MKFKKSTFRLNLQKSKIAKVSHQYAINGGLSSLACLSFPKTLPNLNKQGVCQSTDPINCP